MEDVRILMSNGKELSLQGDLLARARTNRSGSIPERWFDLRVYRAADHGFVPVIEFGSTFENENAVTIAEVVDRSHDIENFFFVFEPSEVIADHVLDAMQVGDRQQLLRDTLSMYDPRQRVLDTHSLLSGDVLNIGIATYCVLLVQDAKICLKRPDNTRWSSALLNPVFARHLP